jgi:hypothetical protein
MKKVSVSFTFDEDKLNAAKMFLAQKNGSLDTEMEGFLDSLYRKHVPSGVREYIEMMEGQAAKERDMKKPALPQPAAVPGMRQGFDENSPANNT